MTIWGGPSEAISSHASFGKEERERGRMRRGEGRMSGEGKGSILVVGLRYVFKWHTGRSGGHALMRPMQALPRRCQAVRTAQQACEACMSDPAALAWPQVECSEGVVFPMSPRRVVRGGTSREIATMMLADARQHRGLCAAEITKDQR